MQFIILILHVLVCVSLIALVLLQHGKGADIGAAFGAGASQTVFGSSGASSFLLKLTGALAAIFFLTSIYLGYLDSQSMKQNNNFQFTTQNANSIVIPSEKTNTNESNSINSNTSSNVKSPTKQGKTD